MGWLEALRTFLNKYVTYSERLDSCITDVTVLREEKAGMVSDNERQGEIIGDLSKEIASLQEKKEEEIDPLAEARDYWDNKYPKKDISYHGRYMPNLKEGVFIRKRIEIDVRLFVQPNDWVIKVDIINHQLMVKDPARCNDEILKIYKHTRTKPLNPYRYAFDKPNVGVSEFWFFPHETRVAKQADCDDWGNELASYLLAAGVPPFRVRCVAGTTYGGIGHLTVYVLADDLKTWYHINSTTPIGMIRARKLEELPQNGDESDKIGIKDVWFSYNRDNSWSIFKTEAAAGSYKKRPGFLRDIMIH